MTKPCGPSVPGYLVPLRNQIVRGNRLGATCHASNYGGSFASERATQRGE
jgi:hypothetical protein